MAPQYLNITEQVPHILFPQRLDQAIAKLLADYSRSQIKGWILEGKVKVNDQVTILPNKKILGGEIIKISVMIEREHEQYWKAQNIALNIVYEDDDIIVINKPRDMVVHSGAGNLDGTILNALLYYYPAIANVPRAGIVHRLDKNTTGLMIVGKTLSAQTKLVELLRTRSIIREYEAITIGIINNDGTVEQPIARHATKRTHMTVNPLGKPAITHYSIIERFRAHTRLRLRLETGRTHQIRVHMAYMNHHLVGDQLYRSSQQNHHSNIEVLRRFNRQALHATTLRLHHPITAREMELHAALPQDMVELVNALQEDRKNFL
ncbi:23S rRNA pseudouridine(1911/1915/1917) synthase RluD [Candidatus Palibaumannia cicadellinicola]|uniref:Pseudouridine synthase n=1 Tax=Baumannia cicadellinicola subsp. Homalodisca coagulata TaxID=374463 RepID=Q1LTR4_BAUCH|nr:23S rRNA pseudouridine(1911/1915/1917) synthase RluD [Candidatus Baumannia cicadellinicola]ABF14255.1 ribosomal large subunit pseudouridine synthase D [Baumannia cicadellinicola str. Hc (Homalodisca coagulata)]MBS0032931.1 23S rRNA pseudouridine(1911/1915/1917) synthase RluD [Candidatus Baumannia cicadellinicola]MCJ7462366.1 23S rRNA pseudouridine(1911/1915/1917) synthase RluD [Candidatus Baumannia cicadellinicola]MCJ7462683.1 23S rRNA pseudouridine(1911/1915/1917) synthase RluD [Candidatus 